MGMVLWMAGAALLLLPAAAEAGMAYYTRARCFDDLAAVPTCDYALVLGTAKYVAGGGLAHCADHAAQAEAFATPHLRRISALCVDVLGVTARSLSLVFDMSVPQGFPPVTLAARLRLERRSHLEVLQRSQALSTGRLKRF